MITMGRVAGAGCSRMAARLAWARFTVSENEGFSGLVTHPAARSSSTRRMRSRKRRIARSLLQLFAVDGDLHVVIPRVEVEVLPIDLDLPALEIRGLAAKRLLWRAQGAAVVEVDDHAIAVLVADVEVGDFRVIALLHAVARIARQPAP